MKSLTLERIYAALLLIILVGIVVHAPLTVWLGSIAPDYELAIKAWKEILMMVALVVGAFIVTRQKFWSRLFEDRLLQLMTLFAVLHILLLPFLWTGLTSTIAGLMIDLRFLLYFGLVYVLLRLEPGYKRPLLKVLFGSALLVGVFALLQVTVLPKDVLSHIGYSPDTISPYLTVDENENYARINSTLRGPNPLGAYAASGLILLAAFVFRERFKSWIKVGGLAALGIVALWFSYSRSALLALVIGLAIIVFTVGRTRLTKRIWASGLAVAILVIAGIFVFRESPVMQQVILHEDPAESGLVNSNDGHLTSLGEGLRLLVTQPFGAGVGSTGSASLYGDKGIIIENHYLFVAHEVGWLGLALFVGIFGIVLYRLWRQRSDWLSLGVFASGAGLAVIGLLLPVWVDDTIAIVWWGLAGAILGAYDGKKRSGK